MQITTEQLNQAAELLGTTDRNTVLTAVIGTLVKNGVDVKVALNAVFGEGTFEKIAGQVYDALRAQAV